MKRFLSALLTLALLFSPGRLARGDVYISTDGKPQFTGPSDPSLLIYLEDQITAGLEARFSGKDCVIRDVRAVYHSKEYLEELGYNSQSNIFFGYTLAELDARFEGTAYIFTVGEDGQTTVTEFQDHDDAYDKLITNASIGAGVILVGVSAVVDLMQMNAVISIVADKLAEVLLSPDRIDTFLQSVVENDVSDVVSDEPSCNFIIWKQEEPSEE